MHKKSSIIIKPENMCNIKYSDEEDKAMEGKFGGKKVKQQF